MMSLATAPDTTSISSGAEIGAGSGTAGAAATGASHVDANLLAFRTSASHGFGGVENQAVAVDCGCSETTAGGSGAASCDASCVGSGIRSSTAGAALCSSTDS